MRISDWSSDVCSSDLADDFFIKRLTSHHRRSAEEVSCLSALQADIRQLRPHENFIQELAPNRYVYILRKGWSITYKLLPDGRRQVLSILLPGDRKSTRLNSSH